MAQFSFHQNGVYVILEAIPQPAFHDQTFRAVGVCQSREQAEKYAGIGRIIQGPVPFFDSRMSMQNDPDIFPFKPSLVEPPNDLPEKASYTQPNWGPPLHVIPEHREDLWNQNVFQNRSKTDKNKVNIHIV